MQKSETSNLDNSAKSALTNSNEDRTSSYSMTNSSSERKMTVKKRILTSFNSNCININMTTEEMRSSLMYLQNNNENNNIDASLNMNNNVNMM